MKSDVNGCSTAQSGSESFETFENRGKVYFQYDYRHSSGMLFSCVRPSLDRCRAALAAWLVQNNLDITYSN